MFCNKRVNFPFNNVDERSEWMRLLGVKANIDSDLRASICHFHVADLVLESESMDDLNSPIIDISVRKKGNSQCPLVGRNTVERNSPPRPSAELFEVQLNVNFFNRSNADVPSVKSFGLHFSQHSCIATRSRTKRIAEPIAVNLEEDVLVEEHPAGIQKEKRSKCGPKLGGDENPLYETGVVTADLLLAGFRTMQDHARGCDGNFKFRRIGVRTKGLCLKVTCWCSHGSECKFIGFKDSSMSSPGKFEWLSTATIDIPLPNGKTKKVNTADFKHALAIAITPSKDKHIEQIFQTIGFSPRCTAYITFIKIFIINKYLIDKKQLTIEASLELIRRQKRSVALTMDTGFNSVRRATASTTVTACDGDILFSIVDTTTDAYGKEKAGMNGSMALLDKVLYYI